MQPLSLQALKEMSEIGSGPSPVESSGETIDPADIFVAACERP